MSLIVKHKKFSFFDLAFSVLLAVFFLVGLFTAGSFQGAGKSFHVRTDDSHATVFEVRADSSQKIKSVWLNVGAVYSEIGSDLTVVVKRASSKTVSNAPSIDFGEVKVGNVFSKKGTGKNGALYNWVQIESEETQRVSLLSVTADADFELNEMIATDENGNVVPLQVNVKFSKGYANPKDKLAPAVDSQKSFNPSTAVKYNFTQEEAYTMLSVQNLFLGNTYTEDCVYNLDGRWNTLSTLLYAPSVALFGACTMAVRLPSLIATTLALAFVYMFARLLFKDDKSAFACALLTCLGGLAFTSGVVGVAYSFTFSALFASAYFMLRFFSEGLSSANPVKGARNVLYSGVFAAVAIAVDFLCVFPTLAIAILFLFGLKRQKAAYSYELEKAETDEEKAREKTIYAYKTKVTVGFALLSFVLCTFVLLLVSCVLGYNALVRTYDNPAAPVVGFIPLFFKGIGNAFSANATEYALANASSAFTWFLPVKPATFYDGVNPAALGNYLGFNAVVSPVLSVFSLLAFAYATFATVKGFTVETQTKELKRDRRIYFTLLGVVLSTLIAGLLVKNASVASALAFTTGYYAFIPFAVNLLATGKGLKRPFQKTATVLLCVITVLAAICFVLSIPSTFGFEISEKLADALFGWTNLKNNGYFPA